jgi:tetratricopeptide (TPR) repeat protein
MASDNTNLGKYLCRWLLGFLFLSGNFAIANYQETGSLYEKGMEYYLAGKYETGLDCLSDYLKRNPTRNKKKYECHKTIGNILWMLNRIDESTENYRQAIKTAQEIGLVKGILESTKAIEVNNAYSEATKLRKKGNIVASDAQYGKALMIAREIKNDRYVQKIASAWNFYLLSEGKYTESIRLGLEALELAMKSGSENEAFALLNNLGAAYSKKSEYATALSYYFRALQQANKNMDRKSIILCLSNICVHFVNIGEYERAYDYLAEALSKLKPEDSDIRITTLFSNLGDVFKIRYLINDLSLPPILYTTRPPEGNRKVCTASFPTEHRTSTCSQISGP